MPWPENVFGPAAALPLAPPPVGWQWLRARARRGEGCCLRRIPGVASWPQPIPGDWKQRIAMASGKNMFSIDGTKTGVTYRVRSWRSITGKIERFTVSQKSSCYGQCFSWITRRSDGAFFQVYPISINNFIIAPRVPCQNSGNGRSFCIIMWLWWATQQTAETTFWNILNMFECTRKPGSNWLTAEGQTSVASCLQVAFVILCGRL